MGPSRYGVGGAIEVWGGWGHQGMGWVGPSRYGVGGAIKVWGGWGHQRFSQYKSEIWQTNVVLLHFSC